MSMHSRISRVLRQLCGVGARDSVRTVDGSSASSCGSDDGSSAPTFRRALALFVVTVAAVLAVSAPALAAPGYTAEGAFGSYGAGAGQFQLPEGMAVDQATGDVYVADMSDARIEKFDAAGNFIAAWGRGVVDGNPNRFEVCTSFCQAGFGTNGGGQEGNAPAFLSPVGVAVDNDPASPSYEDVYVADAQDEGLVQKFSPSGAFLGILRTPDGLAWNAVGIATDPTGHVWVDQESSVVGWDSSGNFLGSSSMSENVTQTFLILGNPFTVDANGDAFVGVNQGATEKFAADGTDLGELDPANQNVTALTTDLSSNLVYDAQGGSVEVYDGGATLPASPVASFGSFGRATGIAVNSATGMVYVADAFGGQIDVFQQTTLADVMAGSPTAVQPGSATLNGTVNPVGSTVSSCQFEYVDDAAYDSAASDPYSQGQTAQCASTPSGSSPVAVSADVSGLTPDTTYHYRLAVTNPGGTADSADRTFTTAGPPEIGGSAVESADASTATFEARVNPHGFDTTVHFEYGTSSSYGQSAPVPDADAGAGLADQQISAGVAGLEPGTTYHFRVVAASSQGTADGPDQTFTTSGACPNEGLRSGYSANLPDCRAYEQVTPASKDTGTPYEGGLVASLKGDVASADGNGMAWTSAGALPGSASDGSYFLSTRGPDSWATVGEIPPQAIENGQLCNTQPAVEAWSPDLTAHVLGDGAVPAGGVSGTCGGDDPALVAGEPHGVWNLFSQSGSGGYQLVSPNPVAGSPADASLEYASADLSHVVFDSRAQLTVDAPPGQVNLYDWSAGGGVQLVNKLDDGTILPFSKCCKPMLAGPGHAISADGSKIFFPSGDGGTSTSLYVRENDDKTVQVDASQAGGPGGDGVFEWASADGSVVYFEAPDTSGLTSDTVPGSGWNLYRFDTDTGQLSDLTPVADAQVGGGKSFGPGSDGANTGVLGASGDGSYVYFVADGVLAPGAAPGDCVAQNTGQFRPPDSGACSLYVWHDGTTRFIARLSGADSYDWNTVLSSEPYARVSPDGRYAAFDSYRSLTGADTAGHEEIYLYDYDTGRLSCPSCSPTGAPSTRSVTTLATTAAGPGAFYTFARDLAVTPGGAARVFFQTADPLLPQATNGQQNVYEYETQGGGSCSEPSGCLYLISSGTSSDQSVFFDASPTGDDVFFATVQRLAGTDTDETVDLYDARVDGGFPASAPPPSCVGDGCKPAPGTAPAAPTVGSATFVGPGDTTASAGRARVVRKAVRGTRFVLSVRVPAPGRITISGTDVRTSRRSVTRAGIYRLTVVLTSRARRALKHKRRLRVAVRMSYAPRSGQPSGVSVAFTVKR